MGLKQKFDNFSIPFSKVIKMIISIMLIFIFGCLSLWSFVETTKLNILEDNPEKITFLRDNVVVNAIIMLVFLVVMSLLFKYNILGKINTKIFAAILLVYTFAIGLLWILSSKSSPSADSYILQMAGAKFANGDFSMLNPDEKYFHNYPFQLGYALICQIVNCFFKGNQYLMALQILNLIFLVIIISGLILMMKYLTKNKQIVNLTILLFFFCPQGIMFTTFIYGNLIGFAFAVWAVLLEIKYFKTNKKYLMLISAFLIGISIMIKSNNMIILAAMCIVLLIKFFDNKKIWNLVSIAICILLGTNILNVVVSGYEHKANVDLGSGVPKILWFNMGLHESSMGMYYGWYDGQYTIGIYENNNYDSKASTNEGIKQIKERLKYFSDNHEYAITFFTEKTLSEWNEPTYASIWVSKARGHYSTVSNFVENIYNGPLGKRIEFYMNQYQQIIYAFVFVSFCLLYKKRNAEDYLPPLIILGAFLYHVLFEAKSQYLLTYFLLLIPLSACGICYISQKNLLSKIKNVFKVGASENT